MGKYIQLAEDVYTRWKNCMSALAMSSDSDMADFLLNRLLSDKLREFGHKDSLVDEKLPSHSTSAATRTEPASPPSGSQMPSPPSGGPNSEPLPAATRDNPGHVAMEKKDPPTVQRQHSPKFPDFVDYKHKLERRKRKPTIEKSESSLKVAKTDQELPASSVVRQSTGEPRQTSSRNPAIASRASSPGDGQGTGLPEAVNPSATMDRASIQSANGRRQDVIVTPQSLSLRSAETGHVAFGEEAMDLSVRPTKDSFSQADSWRNEPADQNKTTSAGQREKQQQYQSTIKTVHNSSFTGVYDSSDQSDGSQRCASPPRKFSSLKGSSDDSGSDFDCCARSSEESPRQDEAGKDDSEAALNPPRSGSHMGGIESIVQRLHQVKSETPSRSDSEDESGYYAVTFQDLIARTISRCDRYVKTQQRGKRKRVPKTSSELSAARKEEITAAKKLLERVNKSKRDKFKLTVNCSTDGSQHVRNAAASEAIATLVRSVWHKENPKPIGQVIKEMVARRLAGQEGDLDDPRRNNGQSKRKGPMTIKDILSSRSDNVVQEFERSTKHSSNDEDEEELMVVSDDGEKDEKGNEGDLALSAAETLRKMAKINERRESDDDQEQDQEQGITSSDHAASPTRSQSAFSRRSSDKVSSNEKQGREREIADYDSEDGEAKDSDQKKKAKRRSRKKKRRWAKMFAKANKLNGPERSNFPEGDRKEREYAKDIVEEEDNVLETEEAPKCEMRPATPPSPESNEENSTQWPAEAMQTKGSIAHSISQSLEKTGMGTMRSLVEQIHEEEEEEEEEVEVDVVEETQETPLLRQTKTDDHWSSPERDRAEPAPVPTRDPKCSVISHSISQILEQKSETSSVESRMRPSSCSSAKINRPLAHPMVLHEANTTMYGTASSDNYPSAPHRIVAPLPGVGRSIASHPVANSPCSRETEGQEGAGGKDVKSISTATDFLIRFALMQNDGGREGAVQSQ